MTGKSEGSGNEIGLIIHVESHTVQTYMYLNLKVPNYLISPTLPMKMNECNELINPQLIFNNVTTQETLGQCLTSLLDYFVARFRAVLPLGLKLFLLLDRSELFCPSSFVSLFKSTKFEHNKPHAA